MDGGVPFRVLPLDHLRSGEPWRSNCFTVIWVKEGGGVFHPDLASYQFGAAVLLFANPYQTVFLNFLSPLQGALLQFHANFLCIETHHEEVGCNGVLFNDLYGEPVVRCDSSQATGEFDHLVDQMRREAFHSGIARDEALLALLKILLIKAARIKLDQLSTKPVIDTLRVAPVIVKLGELIELHYRSLHRPNEYAKLLSMTPKALGKIVKEVYGKTLTELIRERLFKHAKWQLLHTLRPVKEIAAEVGFTDEFYFSRVFKVVTGLSPSLFREFETRIRQGSNLSM